jgi:hypothetical protein
LGSKWIALRIWERGLPKICTTRDYGNGRPTVDYGALWGNLKELVHWFSALARDIVRREAEDAFRMHQKGSALGGQVDADRRRQKVWDATCELQRGERLREYVDRDPNNNRFSELSADNQRVLEDYDTGRTATKRKRYAVPLLSTFRSTE